MESEIKLSSKHHYLPKFYLKGFTNPDGQFAIFDYSKNRLKKNMHNPTGHFYINERNTIDVKENKTDILEQLYSKIDDKHAVLLSYIQSLSHPTISREQMLALIEFISYLFWRIPANDELYENEYQNNPLFGNMFKVKNKTTGEIISNEETKELLKSDAVMKGARGFASSISQASITALADVGSWGLTYSNDGLKVCSDNPIIFKNPNQKNIFEDDFIFPVTKNHLLTRSFKIISKNELPPEFSMYLDLLIFKQGKIFCCGARKDYLETIIRLSPQFDFETLKQKVFSYFS